MNVSKQVAECRLMATRYLSLANVALDYAERHAMRHDIGATSAAITEYHHCLNVAFDYLHCAERCINVRCHSGE